MEALTTSPPKEQVQQPELQQKKKKKKTKRTIVQSGITRREFAWLNAKMNAVL